MSADTSKSVDPKYLSGVAVELKQSTNVEAYGCNVFDKHTTSKVQITKVVSVNEDADIPPPPEPIITPAYVNPNSYQLVGYIDNIDERNRHNPLAVPEYAQEMFLHFREQERTASVRPHFLSMQPQIDETMRAVLVDWLINVQTQFELAPESLYLAVNLVDRYLEKAEVIRTKLQLLGVAALFVAAKYEEVWTPRISDFVSVCDSLYSRKEIVQMERDILNKLHYKISVPTAYTFLVRFLQAGHSDTTIAQLSCYILEGSLLSYPLLRYLPSQLAAAAVLIARNSTHRNPWSPTLLSYSQYYEEDILPIARDVLARKSQMNANLLAVNTKYSTKCFGRVAARGVFLSCE